MKAAAEEKAAAAAKAAPATPAAAAGPELKATEIFAMMNAHLQQGNGADIIKKVGGVFNWDIIMKKGGKPVATWELDLKTMPGHVKLGAAKKPDATFTMTDSDFNDVCSGKLSGQNAFMTGKMKIKGNLAKATKFTPDLFPANTPENVEAFRAQQKAKL